jgi:LuxR family maltose regulon positive regulatory protein
VAAPAGYGKSTLLASWLDQADCPNAWLSLDEDDDQLEVFLSYFLAAVDQIHPGAVQETLAMLAMRELPPTRILASSLTNELNRIPGNFILVIDDYHYINQVAIHDLLNELLLHPPHGIGLVIATRSDPPLSLARLRGKGLVMEIRSHDLRFTKQETIELLSRLLGESIREADVQIIDRQFEGWVTGLRLAALTMRDPERVAAVIEQLHGDSQYVQDYLVSEVTDQLPKEIRTFLMKTSILDQLNGPLCDSVVGMDEPVCDGQAYLEWLYEKNLFTIALDDRMGWFRYHQLMREFLQNELKKIYSPDEIAALHFRASIWMAQNGWLEEAIQHALRAGDGEMAANLLVQHRHDLIDQEQWHRLERWLKLFDPAEVERSPGLGIIEAWLHNVNGRWQEELVVLSRVESLLESTSLPPEIAQPIQGEIHLMRANLTGWTYNGSEVLKHTEIALELLPRQWRYVYTSAYMIDSYGHLLSGDIDLARDQLQRGLADPQITSQPQYKTMLMFGLVGLFWASLNLPDMLQFSRQYLAHAEDYNLQEAISVANYFLGCVHYLQNDLAAAQKYFSDAVETRYLVTLNWQTQAACGFALTYCAMGKIEQAVDVLEKFQAKLIERDNFMLQNVIKSCRTELAFRQGNITEANHWAESYDPQPIVGLQMFFIPQLTLVKVWLLQDTPTSRGKATNLLAQLMEIAKGAHLKSAQLPILLLQALLEQKRGNEAAAFKKLEEAFHLAEPNGIIRPFVDLGPQMAKLLIELRQRGVEQDYITQVIEAFPTQHPVVSPTHRGALIEPLTDRELEVLTLLAQRKRNQDIADDLVITLGTVKQYTHNIYRKLDVKSRQEAVAKATSLGILMPEP